MLKIRNNGNRLLSVSKVYIMDIMNSKHRKTNFLTDFFLLLSCFFRADIKHKNNKEYQKQQYRESQWEKKSQSPPIDWNPSGYFNLRRKENRIVKYVATSTENQTPTFDNHIDHTINPLSATVFF